MLPGVIVLVRRHRLGCAPGVGRLAKHPPGRAQKKMPATLPIVGTSLTYAEKLQYEGYVRRQETDGTIQHLAKRGTSIRQSSGKLVIAASSFATFCVGSGSTSCRPDGALMLIDLKTPEILDGGCIGGLAKKSSEAPNMANVVLLRVLPKATHLHVLKHTLAERSVRGKVVTASMVSSFPLKELHGRKATSPLAKPEQYHATSPHATLPRSGFMHWSQGAGRFRISALPRDVTGKPT